MSKTDRFDKDAQALYESAGWVREATYVEYHLMLRECAGVYCCDTPWLDSSVYQAPDICLKIGREA